MEIEKFSERNDIESGIHGIKVDSTESAISPEERIENAKAELRKIVEKLKLTSSDVEKLFDEFDNESGPVGHA